MNPFNIVKDSSIWKNPHSFAAADQLDGLLYTGVVKKVDNDKETGELRHVVEIHYRGDILPIQCRTIRRWGGAFNYEDTIFRDYNYNTPVSLSAKAGDIVLVGLLGGQGREGVILGGLTHPTRKNLLAKDGPEYKSEFNGIETYINKDGEYTQTFKAQPTNLSALTRDPGGPVPAPQYDTTIGSSYLKWDKTGSFTINDNAVGQPQKLFIDKQNGKIELLSGAVSLKMDKNANSTELISSNSIKLTTSAYTCVSPNIKLGGDIAFQQAILGTIYRTNETVKHNLEIAQLGQLMALLLVVGAGCTAAGADPILNSLAPIAAASLAATGAAVISLAPTTILPWIAALTAFEVGTPLYLSPVVKLL